MFASLPVFMYHSISRHKHRLCVAPELFEDHCRTLANAGWRGVTLHEAEEYFINGTPLPEKSCLFTFDDGYLDNFVYAEPLLRRYGHHGVIFPVADMLSDAETVRPTIEDMGKAEDLSVFFAQLDARQLVKKNGRRVERILFCSWAEIRQMHHRGNLAAAPHSLRHDRVVRSLDFARLHKPRKRPWGFFGVPPFEMPWGFPIFDFGHFLADRAYTIDPAVFELVNGHVPQRRSQARRFLKDKSKAGTVVEALKALPLHGTQESAEEYRKRVRVELEACRDIFAAQLGSAPRSFCWPWGDSSQVSVEEAQRAGFQVFFCTGHGPNLAGRPGRVHRWAIRGGSGAELLALARQEANSLRSTLGILRSGLTCLRKDKRRR